MAEIDKEIAKMGVFALASVSLAVSTVIGIVLLEKMKTISVGNFNSTAPNTSIDAFVAGLAIFGSFMSIIALALVGKIIMGLFKSGS